MMSIATNMAKNLLYEVGRFSRTLNKTLFQTKSQNPLELKIPSVYKQRLQQMVFPSLSQLGDCEIFKVVLNYKVHHRLSLAPFSLYC